MPKVKTEKPERPAPYDVEKKNSDTENKPVDGENKPVEAEKKPAEGEKKNSGWGSGGQLFGTESTELTFQGAGFKDKDKALETLKLLDGRDISYQFQIINSMYHRAKVILKRTKDAEKVRNLTEAIEVFENWLNDYRAHSRSRENFSYLPLEIMEAFHPLAERYGIKMDAPGSNFFQAYKDVEGDLKRLRMVKVDKEDEKSVTWDVQRNNHLRELSERIKKEHLPLFETDMEFRGLPTKEHVEMIMWSYSSELAKIKKTIPLIAQKLNPETAEAE
ncbi:uncharacterized protein Ude [Anabrus simplex]|uniref:uncharacterized protein Ude n=1 Tax=Anabrus simplex TaxID=316456 RepID=UPI0034DDC4DB